MSGRKFFIAGVLTACFAVSATVYAPTEICAEKITCFAENSKENTAEFLNVAESAHRKIESVLGGERAKAETVTRTARADKDKKEFYVGGMPAGFTLNIRGVQVAGISHVTGKTVTSSPAEEAGIKTGDVIEKVAGVRIENTRELNEALEKNGEKITTLEINRRGERLKITLSPIRENGSGRYKIGILARDGVSGIGTVTYIEKESGNFGALGHPVSAENNDVFSGGELFSCRIVGVSKGVRGKAGELRGTFLGAEKIGKNDKVTDCGIFGKIDETYTLTGNLTAYCATADEVSIGNAYIYSTIEGETPKKYGIDLVKVDKNNKSNKNFVIKITDKELLEKTGGIVQGMSGSPIMQDGKLIGAVTHVFVNDPTRGYGVALENMLNSAK